MRPGLVEREAVGGLEGPVVPVGRGQPLEEGQAVAPGVAAPAGAAERDGQGRHVRHQHVPGVRVQVPAHQPDGARPLPRHPGGRDRHDPLLARGGAGSQGGRPAGRRLRLGRPPHEEFPQRPRGVGEGEVRVGGQCPVEGGVDAAVLGQEAVEEVGEVARRLGRGGGHRLSVAVDVHAGSILRPAREGRAAHAAAAPARSTDAERASPRTVTARAADVYAPTRECNSLYAGGERGGAG